MEFSCNGTKLIEILGRPGVEAEETNGRRYSFFVVWASNLRGGHCWDLTLINNVYSCKPASNGILHGGKAVDAKKRELKTSLSWTQLLECDCSDLHPDAWTCHLLQDGSERPACAFSGCIPACSACSCHFQGLRTYATWFDAVLQGIIKAFA